MAYPLWNAFKPVPNLTLSNYSKSEKRPSVLPSADTTKRCIKFEIRL